MHLKSRCSQHEREEKITHAGSLLPDSISGSPDCRARYGRLCIRYTRARDSFYEGYVNDCAYKDNRVFLCVIPVSSSLGMMRSFA